MKSPVMADRMLAAPDAEGKRWPLSIRTTQRLKERIEAAAKASGRSIAAEAEFRMEMSFRLMEDGE